MFRLFKNQENPDKNKIEELAWIPMPELKMTYSNHELTFTNAKQIHTIEEQFFQKNHILLIFQNTKTPYAVEAKVKSINPIGENKLECEIQFYSRVNIIEKMAHKCSYTNLNTVLTKKENNLLTSIKDKFTELPGPDYRLKKSKRKLIISNTEPLNILDKILVYLEESEATINEYLKLKTHTQRLNYISKLILKKTELRKIKTKTISSIEERFDKQEKRLILQEEIKQLQSELGINSDETIIIEEIENGLKQLKLSKETQEKVDREFRKLKTITLQDPEFNITRNYLQWIIDLPWNFNENNKVNMAHAIKTLDISHHGLKKVKEKIQEYLAIYKLSNNHSPNILCLAGPPGVGKTSLGKSIAEAMNKEFARLSLGGVHDEAEIRGHRRTYIGALPGQIIQTMRTLNTTNPVILLDEVDKLSKDARGNPAAALLEVLDPEQNTTFRDHYLEVEYDLSNIFFLVTANNIDEIPAALADRMEIISLPGYTVEEKMHIAKKHVIPKQISINGLSKLNVNFKDEAIKDIIKSYTLEAGVRELERQVINILGKIALESLTKNRKSFTINSKYIKSKLGEHKYVSELTTENSIGTANGLAWTEVGGTMMIIESTAMKGSDELLLTGNLGNILKESAKLALSYIKANAKTYGLKENFAEDLDIHIHLPEGSIPKDGPSAGVTLLMSLISLFTKQKLKAKVAMTGEITLTGKVLAIGGLKEKLLAAKENGIKTVFIPYNNNRNLKEIDAKLIKGLTIIPVKNVSEIAKQVFPQKKTTKTKK